MPDLVTTLITAPPARPYSAEYALRFTWNSWTASWLNWYGARPEPVRPSVWPKKVLLLSAPSITRLFSVPRWPAKLMSPPRGSRVTPGVVSTKSMKLRPFTGRFATERSLTTDDCWERVASSSGASAVTVISSWAEATFSVTSTVSVWPMFRVKPPRFVVAKPVSETETS